MTADERMALLFVQGSLELLRNSIIKCDPQRELESKARDILDHVKAIMDGKVRVVSSFNVDR